MSRKMPKVMATQHPDNASDMELLENHWANF